MGFSCCETARRRTKRPSLAPTSPVRHEHMALIWCDVRNRKLQYLAAPLAYLCKPCNLSNVGIEGTVTLCILFRSEREETSVTSSASPSRQERTERTHHPRQLHITLLTLETPFLTFPEPGSRERGRRQTRQHPYRIHSKWRPAHIHRTRCTTSKDPTMHLISPRKLAYWSQATLSQSS